MIDLTATIETFGETPDITHMDLYYVGVRSPLSCLVTDCVLIDLTEGAEQVDLTRLPELDLVKAGNSVLLKTGWERYRGTPAYDNSPSVDKRLIECLVDKGVVLVLIDSPGVYGGTRGPEHNAMDQYLADNQAYAVENVVNLDRLTSKTFQLLCFPLPITSRNNAPCRVVANLNV